MAGTFNIKTLAIGTLTGSTFYPIYVPAAGASGLVKSIVIVNTSSIQTIDIGLAIGASTGGSISARLIPAPFTIDAGAMLETTSPYTLNEGFCLSARAGLAGAIDYSVHGVEEV